MNKLSKRQASLLNKDFNLNFEKGQRYDCVFDSILDSFDVHSPKNLDKSRKAKALRAYITQKFQNTDPDFLNICHQNFLGQLQARQSFLRKIREKTRKEQEFLQSWSRPISECTENIINKRVICSLPASHFYKTPEWKKLRYEAFKFLGRKCFVCGAGHDDAPLHVDHIKPRSLFPDYALEIWNLQILCEDCHTAKGLSSDNWRAVNEK